MNSQWKPVKERWSSAWRDFPHESIGTNNFIESWHNQLKTNYLGFMRRQRLDFLIHVLAKKVYPDFKHAHFQVLVGYAVRRKTKAERMARSKAMAWDIEDAQDMVDIQEVDQDIIVEVQSFEVDDVWYHLILSTNDNHDNPSIKGCSCVVGQAEEICKHMFLAERISKYPIQQSRFLLDDPSRPLGAQNSAEDLLQGKIPTSSSFRSLINANRP